MGQSAECSPSSTCVAYSCLSNLPSRMPEALSFPRRKLRGGSLITYGSVRYLVALSTGSDESSNPLRCARGRQSRKTLCTSRQQCRPSPVAFESRLYLASIDLVSWRSSRRVGDLSHLTSQFITHGGENEAYPRSCPIACLFSSPFACLPFIPASAQARPSFSNPVAPLSRADPRKSHTTVGSISQSR